MRALIGLLVSLIMVVTVRAENQGEFMKNQSTTQTLCLGRFLVDVPRDAYIFANASEYRWDKVSVTKGISQEKFQQALLSKENHLKEIKHRTDPSLLRQIGKNSDGLPTVFVFWETPTARRLYETESYKWIKGSQFLIKGNVNQENVPIAVEMANRSLSELQYRRDNEIPSTPGFCMDGGFFAGEPSIPHYESTFIHIRFKSHPDLKLIVRTDMNGDKLGKGLLFRVDNRNIPAIYAEVALRLKTLRRGSHPVGNIEANEHLETFPGGETYSVHLFEWEALGKPTDIYAPRIALTMATGETFESKKLRPGLSDKQAIEFFDNIVNTIRIRPVSQGQ